MKCTCKQISMIEMEKQRSPDCGCLQNSVVVESLVITLTIVSALAITGENLITFDLITVPKSVNGSLINSTGGGGKGVFREDTYILDILDKVFHYSSLAIAGLFFIEIFFKVCTLHKRFITKPWQIFDTVVVLATLGVELAFHFLHFDEPLLYCVTYIVVLRLWRIPMVCNIRARVAQQSVEQDIELYRHGRQKAEEKCNRMEDTLSQQTETIRKLEEALQNLAGSKARDMANGGAYAAAANGHLPQSPSGAYSTSNTKNEESATAKAASTPRMSLKKCFEQRSKQILPPGEMETGFTDGPETPDLHSPTRENKLFKESGKISSDPVRKDDRGLSDSKGKQNAAAAAANNNNVSAIKPVKSDSKPGDATDETHKKSNSLPRSEGSYNLPTVTTRPNQMPARPRKRRSSTSEYIDYSNLSSPELDSVFYEDVKGKSSSYPKLDAKKGEKTDTKDRQGTKNKEVNSVAGNAVEKKTSSASDSTSDSSGVGTGGRGRRKERTRARRFTSCPEYVFTQRMSITNDESLLIEDRHTIDPSVYDNYGFDYDENIRLQVLAEFDGTKTYRNEDGIPMTSL